MFTKEVFYPGQTIIKEGTSEKKLLVIIEGVCKSVCNRTKQQLDQHEYREDPTKPKRDAERLARINPNKRYAVKDKESFNKWKPNFVIGEQFGTVQQNGMLSKTLKQLQLGTKTTNEWIGEEFLLMFRYQQIIE